MQRKIALALTAATALTGVAGTAYAATADGVNQGLTVKSTGKKGTKAKPKPLKLDVVTTTSHQDPSKDGTYGTTKAVISFDKNIKFNNKKFPTCTEAQIVKDASKCPAGSKVGTGSAQAVAGEGGSIKVNPSIVAYNGPGGTFLMKLNPSPNDPVKAENVIPGKLSSASGKYGSKLTVTIPKSNYYQLGLQITLKRFEVKTGGTYKGVPYIASAGCTGGKYNYKGDFTYTEDPNGSGTPSGKKSVTATSKC